MQRLCVRRSDTGEVYRALGTWTIGIETDDVNESSKLKLCMSSQLTPGRFRVRLCEFCAASDDGKIELTITDLKMQNCSHPLSISVRSSADDSERVVSSSDGSILLCEGDSFQIGKARFHVELLKKKRRELPKAPASNSSDLCSKIIVNHKPLSVTVSRGDVSNLLVSLEEKSWRSEKEEEKESMVEWDVCELPEDHQEKVEQAVGYMCKHTRLLLPEETTAGLRESINVAIDLIDKDMVDSVLDKFIASYEECHEMRPTEVNPSPEDEPVIRLLCRFVFVEQGEASRLESLLLWLHLIKVLATASLHVRYVLLSEKFQGITTGLLMWNDCIKIKVTVCHILSQLSNTILPDGLKFPLHEGYVDIIVGSLERSSSEEFTVAACQALSSIAEALSLELWPPISGFSALPMSLSQKGVSVVRRMMGECQRAEIKEAFASLCRLGSLRNPSVNVQSNVAGTSRQNAENQSSLQSKVEKKSSSKKGRKKTGVKDGSTKQSKRKSEGESTLAEGEAQSVAVLAKAKEMQHELIHSAAGLELSDTIQESVCEKKLSAEGGLIPSKPQSSSESVSFKDKEKQVDEKAEQKEEGENCGVRESLEKDDRQNEVEQPAEMAEEVHVTAISKLPENEGKFSEHRGKALDDSLSKRDSSNLAKEVDEAEVLQDDRNVIRISPEREYRSKQADAIGEGLQHEDKPPTAEPELQESEEKLVGDSPRTLGHAESDPDLMDKYSKQRDSRLDEVESSGDVSTRKTMRKSWAVSAEFVPPRLLNEEDLAAEISVETSSVRHALEKRKKVLDDILLKCHCGLNKRTLREIVCEDLKQLEIAAMLNLLTSLSSASVLIWDVHSLYGIFEVLGKSVATESKPRHVVEVCNIFRYFLNIFESIEIEKTGVGDFTWKNQKAKLESCYEVLKQLHDSLVDLLRSVPIRSPMENAKHGAGQDEAWLARHTLLACLDQVFTS
eukprot:m.34056 g.34056  ORF g.34056 m.34056 type:complete len:957 (+) comp31944_c0_seq3:30-2900(+)